MPHIPLQVLLGIAFSGLGNLRTAWGASNWLVPHGTTISILEPLPEATAVLKEFELATLVTSAVFLSPFRLLASTYENGQSRLYLIHNASAPAEVIPRSFGQIQKIVFHDATQSGFILESHQILAFRLEKGQIHEFRTILSQPDTESDFKSLAFDPCGRKLFWINLAQSTIESMELEQSESTLVIHSNLSQPGSLALDHDQMRLFWTETKNYQTSLYSSFYNGSLTHASCPILNYGHRPFDLLATEDDFILSDWQSMAVMAISRQDAACQPRVLKHFRSRPMTLSRAGTQPPLNCHQSKGGVPLRAAPKYLTTPAGVEEPECHNFCLNGGQCHLTTARVPTCQCAGDFGGRRCQMDPCFQFCLNGGVCQLDPVSFQPQCQCRTGTEGFRCQSSNNTSQIVVSELTQTNDEDRSSSNSLQMTFIVLSCILLATNLFFIGIIVHVVRRRSRSPPKVVNKNQGRNRTFSGPRSSKASSEENPGFCDGKSSVMVDLEDCCQMTLCHQPCVDATFRKANRRGASTAAKSPSKSIREDELGLMEDDEMGSKSGASGSDVATLVLELLGEIHAGLGMKEANI
eukprot:snap_masked-scaffold101_size371023-processed-gene-2.9 protein:Tk03069 transcript:snap_masked-scaffold101_size371023-processed-gene-2.9-mRNA-1 annotation:"protein cueball isoform x4"